MLIQGPRSLASPPGYRLLAIADFWFSNRSYQLVLEPVVRDLQHEFVGIQGVYLVHIGDNAPLGVGATHRGGVLLLGDSGALAGRAERYGAIPSFL